MDESAAIVDPKRTLVVSVFAAVLLILFEAWKAYRLEALH
jgi:hypothetical protein